jgi:hypothetical protein
VYDFLTQVRDGYIRSTWREEGGMASLGLKGRRYSGYNKGDQNEYFDSLIAAGVNKQM